MLSSEIERLVKITLIGFPACGKTTLAKLLSQNEIKRLYFPTHGLDLKTVKVDDYILRLWDLGGQHSYLKTYSRDYLLGSDIILIALESILGLSSLISISSNHYTDLKALLYSLTIKL